ncbi:unnamed protein product [Menidia menidia]|uniref:(Atlantic silverside) hypothetical protein n=1 Tax=Menidia menidia TaxID=238744 RepID=A0A8S4AZC3_9TELE|nr:unnamed protein product [Menidia menidia]
MKPGRGKELAAQGALRSGVVAFMVLGVAVLTLALAVGGRKAMESFDRRHYTRLELNDLHYEGATLRGILDCDWSEMIGVDLS